jgi:hypothetical protein
MKTALQFSTDAGRRAQNASAKSTIFMLVFNTLTHYMDDK